jgi:hypothetical protein
LGKLAQSAWRATVHGVTGMLGSLLDEDRAVLSQN